MADELTVRVEGIKELVASLKTFDVETQAFLKAELKKVGDIVRTTGTQYLDYLVPDPARSADGYRVYIRGGGARVDVEQSIGRTTGLRPDWGATQMRLALVPALEAHQEDVLEGAEAAVALAAARFNG